MVTSDLFASVVRDIKKVQQSVGYCPQFDSLYDELTPREHLQLYCRLRGIPPSDENQVVEWALTKLGLSKFADKLSGTLSGGNKRKLSTAIALIGHPPVIFMVSHCTCNWFVFSLIFFFFFCNNY
ncbi:ATP-binding cassette sub-family A member 2-like [Aplysia californica]|uniref:ATP-binding cassette sub-family A member 2-like n=1 Tax=Aplysia californica TaxID=6500 RepID=A0ABM1W4Q7_APLCA|nr:ATP-binding cassette sub-family A member 2-like [Aplysia californica]